MVSLFKKTSSKQPGELVKALRDTLLDRTLSPKKATEEAGKGIAAIRALMQQQSSSSSSSGGEDSAELVLLANEVYAADLFAVLAQQLGRFDFEAKKDVVYVVTHLVRRQVGTRFPTVEWMSRNGAVLELLVGQYEESDVVITVGAILRECVRHEALARLVLVSPVFWNFFRYVESPKFDVASDTFATFRELLTAHKALVASFLEQNYDVFFERYDALLKSTNFVAKRQSLKLLGELLLDRANFSVMTRYISSVPKLKQIMNLLRDRSRPIQYEAFHVFKVFVANPTKPQPIQDILAANKQALVLFLENFQNDRSEEEQFKEEKAFLIKQIQALP